MIARSISLMGALFSLSAAGVAQQGQPPVVRFETRVYQVANADVSPPLRNIGPTVRPPVREHRPFMRLTLTGPQGAVTDRVAQISAPVAGSLSAVSSFEGVSVETYSPLVAPPDENLAVGPNHIVQLVNVQIGIFNKTTGQMLPGFPKPINSIWTGFGGACETHNDGDPIVRYDREAQRWIVSQLTFDFALLNFHQCLAVSTTEDPAGSYYRYDVDRGYRLPDYPKFAVWPDGWYMSANMFLFGMFLEGSDMCAWERSKLLVGNRTAKVICVNTGSPNFAGCCPRTGTATIRRRRMHRITSSGCTPPRRWRCSR